MVHTRHARRTAHRTATCGCWCYSWSVVCCSLEDHGDGMLSGDMDRPTEVPANRRIRISKRRIIRSSFLLLAALWGLTLHRAHRLHASFAIVGGGPDATNLSGLFRPQHLRRSSGAAAPFEVGSVCLGAKVRGTKTRCADQIQQYMSTKGLTIAQAAEIVADEYPQNCARCRGGDLDGRERYWRFDAAAPPIVPSSGITHYLTTVKARLPPPSDDFNLTTHLAERWKRADTEFFFEYNPSLVLLPEGALRNLKLPAGEEAAYLASFRVTAANECFTDEIYEGMPSEQWSAVRGIEKNYIALAILRPDLSIIPGYEIVIDHFVQTGGNPENHQDITDYRLLCHQNTLHFNINGMPVHVAPFEIISDCEISAGALPSGGQILSNLYGSGFRVVLLKNLTSIWEGGFKGKNYGMFETDETRTNEILVELKVSPIHSVQRIRLDEFYMMNLWDVKRAQWPDPSKWMKRWETPIYEKKKQKGIDVTRRRRYLAVGNATETETPERSFGTIDEFWFGRAVFKEFHHGGACCIAIGIEYFNGGIASEESHLLVGVGHSKTSWKPWYRDATVTRYEKDGIPINQYISFFYAFEPRAPYTMKAKSGYFCFGFGSENEGDHPYLDWARLNKMNFNHTDFDCPKIHYVSSVTEKFGDDTKFIVSYGVNDCIPRMVEMDKSEIARFLVDGPTVP